jgi:hypothetical protein
MADMLPMTSPSEKAVQATATGTDLAALQAKLAALGAAGGIGGSSGFQAPMKQTNMVVVGRDEPAAAVTPQPIPLEAQATVEPMPEGGAAKFYNTETGAYNWQAHAKEAEFRAKMAAGKAKKPAEVKPSPEAPAAGEEAEAGAKEAVAAAGLDWGTLTEKLSVLGELDPEDYEALEGIGLPRAIIDVHIDGLRALQEQTHTKLMESTGGEEGLEDLLTWASHNLQPHEIDAYNAMLGDQRWPVAIDALKARSGFTPPPVAPKLIRPTGGGAPASVSADVYESNEEFQRDIGSKEYKTSEAFRQKVYAKRARSFGGRPQTQPAAMWQQKFTM